MYSPGQLRILDSSDTTTQIEAEMTSAAVTGDNFFNSQFGGNEVFQAR